MVTTTQSREAAKLALREALATHGGNPKHEAVVAAIAQLATLNPTAAPARDEMLRDGQWLLVNAPNFSGGARRADGSYIYTLGRLAFNVFQPTHLNVAIDRVLQPILPTDEGKLTHDIQVEFTTADENVPPLQGIVYNRGICEPIRDNVLKVQFTGGELAPRNPSDIEAWKAIFDNQAQVSKQGLKEKLTTRLLWMMFGIRLSEAMDAKTGQISFTMRRSPKGSLEILYLDEELRITRGNRGTVLVCERLVG